MVSAKPEDNANNTDNFSSIEWLTTQATKKHKEGDLEEAIAYYLEVIASDEPHADWIYGNAVTLLAQVGRSDEALKLGENALTICSESEAIHRAMGLVYEKQENNCKCIEHYKTAVDLMPKQPDWLYCNLAKKLLDSEQIEAAITISQQGVNLHHNFHYLYYILGNALAKQGQWNESIAAYRRVQELNPGWEEIAEKLNLAIYKKTQSARYVSSIDQKPEHYVETDQISTAETLEESSKENLDAGALSSLSNLQDIDIDWLFYQLQQQKIELSVCQQIWQKHQGHFLTLNYGCWLSPRIVYLEANSDKYRVLGEAKILACSQFKYAVANVNFFLISDTQVAGIACFEQDTYLEQDESYQFCIKSNQGLVLVKGNIAQKSYGLQFIDHLQAKSEYRESIEFYPGNLLLLILSLRGSA
ncbi:MAG: tetratricopeptide repeat protein [Cyanobacteria bacterium J06635_13]